MVYYCKDIFDKMELQPPKILDDYLADAKAINGQDLNGDGKPDYRSCTFKKRKAQSYFAIQTVAVAYVQTQGTS